MTEEKALEMIAAALEQTAPGLGDDITIDTDLSDEDILDSLDRMTFLFELEHLNGSMISKPDTP